MRRIYDTVSSIFRKGSWGQRTRRKAPEHSLVGQTNERFPVTAMHSRPRDPAAPFKNVDDVICAGPVLLHLDERVQDGREVLPGDGEQEEIGRVHAGFGLDRRSDLCGPHLVDECHSATTSE